MTPPLKSGGRRLTQTNRTYGTPKARQTGMTSANAATTAAALRASYGAIATYLPTP